MHCIVMVIVMSLPPVVMTSLTQVCGYNSLYTYPRISGREGKTLPNFFFIYLLWF